MSNIVTNKITIRGEGREKIKSLFEKSAIENEYGWVWELTSYGGWILCQVDSSDGICVEHDSIVIRGETQNSPPLELIQRLSSEYPELVFEITCLEQSNLHRQRWVFRDGKGLLQDCIEDIFVDDEPLGEPIVYMRDGEQMRELPDWVAVKDRRQNV
jgi:hypothetical protein